MHAIAEWVWNKPGAELVDGMVLAQPLIMGAEADTRDRTPSTISSMLIEPEEPCTAIDTQVAKAEKAMAGQVP